MNAKNLHDLVADKLERNPALLNIALENIDRWLSQGHGVARHLEEWREKILHAERSSEGLQALLNLLRDRSETAERFKEYAPFAGILTAAERHVFIRECVYSH